MEFNIRTLLSQVTRVTVAKASIGAVKEFLEGKR
jgi:hypothetical protein